MRNFLPSCKCFGYASQHVQRLRLRLRRLTCGLGCKPLVFHSVTDGQYKGIITTVFSSRLPTACASVQPPTAIQIPFGVPTAVEEYHSYSDPNGNAAPLGPLHHVTVVQAGSAPQGASRSFKQGLGGFREAPSHSSAAPFPMSQPQNAPEGPLEAPRNARKGFPVS